LEITDARKEPQGPQEVETLLEDLRDVWVGRGKNFVKLRASDLREEKAARKPLFGPTGNLRAPSLRFGKTLLVGYCEPMYQEFLN